jgi:hypothetical protein
MSNKVNDFYSRLEIQLRDSSVWPTVYKFKFILKSDISEISKLKKMFNDTDADIYTKLSSSKNFTSVTITAKMQSAGEIIKKYKLASEIEGIISL